MESPEELPANYKLETSPEEEVRSKCNPGNGETAAEIVYAEEQHLETSPEDEVRSKHKPGNGETAAEIVYAEEQHPETSPEEEVRSKHNPGNGETAADTSQSGDVSPEEVNSGEVQTNPVYSGDQKERGSEDEHKEVTIVLLGKIGAGKSTLVHNLLQKDDFKNLDQKANKEIKVYEGEREYEGNEIKVKVLDTIGLAGSGKKKKRKKNLKELAKHADGKEVDLHFCYPWGKI